MRKKSGSAMLLSMAVCLLLSACGGRGGEADAPPGGGMSQKLDEDGYTQNQHENALPRKGTVFGELEKKGEEDAILCNLPENVISWEGSIPICHDPVYDILYYTDNNGDDVIYAVKDGKTQIAAELPGTRLFCRNGLLYFLLGASLKTTVDGAKRGNILSYNPVDGEISVISDKVFESMIVYQDMIYCRAIGEEGRYGYTIEYWFYSFETGELTKQEDQNPISFIVDFSRYGGDFLAGIYGPYDRANPVEDIEQLIRAGADPAEIRIQTGLKLCRFDGSGGKPLEAMMELTGQHYVKGDELIWSADEGVHIRNLSSGKEEVRPFPVTHSGFILLDGRLYGDGSYMERADGRTAKCLSITPDYNLRQIQELYTDGTNVYAVANMAEPDSEREKRRLLRVEAVSMEESLPSVPDDIVIFWKEIMNIGEANQSFDEYEYIFWLTPLGDGRK